MTTAKNIKLARVPKQLLRPDLERRQPQKPGRFQDLTGRKLRRCTVVGLAGFIDKQAAWLCRCNCGKLFVSRSLTIMHKPTGCGCGDRKLQRHGGTKKLEYISWLYLRRMHRQEICERWLKFKAFAADMGPRPSTDYSLRRIEISKPYAPGNVEWRIKGGRTAKTLTHAGRTLTLKQWAARLGITYERLRRRYGVDISQALTTPPGKPMPCTKGRVGRSFDWVPKE
jgi:hypothetical protein